MNNANVLMHFGSLLDDRQVDEVRAALSRLAGVARVEPGRKLRKILLQQGENDPNIEVVFVIGKPVDEEGTNPDRLKASMDAISPGSRIRHYDTLIKGAQEAYSAYIEKTKELDKLEAIVNGI